MKGFTGIVWGTHTLHCSAHNLSVFRPSKSLLLAAMVSLWGGSLGKFPFSRHLQVGKDKYDARVDSFFPKDDSEPWFTGESRCDPLLFLLCVARTTHEMSLHTKDPCCE